MREKTKKAAFLTLGCKVNQNETEALAALFQERGYEVVPAEEKADVYIINTCTVTHLADRKSRQMVRRATRANPQAKIVVMGCYAQTSPEEVRRISGVDLVVGTSERQKIIDLLEELPDSAAEPLTVVKEISELEVFEDIELDKLTGRARAYLKVEEGCEQFCSYCIIPYARGPVRSRPLDNALREAERLIRAGFKEIILTGIHLGAYGRDLADGTNLESLLRRLLLLDKSVRWRLSSLEPTEVTPELIQLMKENVNFCPHLHLPLQSAHDEILADMNRPYKTADYAEVVRAVRTAVPAVNITTDIMVGFPGETEKHFQEYLQFVEEIGFGRLHVFQYSPRKGTPAASFPGQVPAREKEERSRRLIELGRQSARDYAAKFIGQELKVLVEKEVQAGIMEGHSENYLRVLFPLESEKRGQIVPVLIMEAGEDFSRGRPCC